MTASFSAESCEENSRLGKEAEEEDWEKKERRLEKRGNDWEIEEKGFELTSCVCILQIGWSGGSVENLLVGRVLTTRVLRNVFSMSVRVRKPFVYPLQHVRVQPRYPGQRSCYDPSELLVYMRRIGTSQGELSVARHGPSCFFCCVVLRELR